jgi:hypothetical protein
VREKEKSEFLKEIGKKDKQGKVMAVKGKKSWLRNSGRRSKS